MEATEKENGIGKRAHNYSLDKKNAIKLGKMPKSEGRYIENSLKMKPAKTWCDSGVCRRARLTRHMEGMLSSEW